MTISSVRVPVINDDVAEGSERFNLMLTVPPSLAPAIRAGNRNTAVGVITDPTSKYASENYKFWHNNLKSFS